MSRARRGDRVRRGIRVKLHLFLRHLGSFHHTQTKTAISGLPAPISSGL